MWGGAPGVGLLVHVRDANFPYGNGTIYGTTRTDASGVYRVMNVPVSTTLTVDIPEQDGYIGYGAAFYASCGGRVMPVGDLDVRRKLTGLSISGGTALPAGPITLCWDAAPTATRYCVAVVRLLDAIEDVCGVGAPGHDQPAGKPTVATSFTSSAQPSGTYAVYVSAVNASGIIVAWGEQQGIVLR